MIWTEPVTVPIRNTVCKAPRAHKFNRVNPITTQI